MFVREAEDHCIIEHLVVGDGVLGDDAIFIFDFHRHGVIREDGGGLAEDGCHLSGLDAVVVIVADPDLQLASFAFTERAAAIKKCFPEAADLGDMKGDGHRVATRQANAEMALWVGGEQGFQFGKIHDRAGWDLRREVRCLGRGQQLPSRSARRATARAASSVSAASSAVLKNSSKVVMSLR